MTRLRACFVVACVLLASPAAAQLARSSGSFQALGSGGVGATTKTYSIVVPSGCTRLFFAFVGPFTGLGTTVTSVVRDGQTFTEVGNTQSVPDPGRDTYLFALNSPNSGTNDVTVTWSASVDYMSAISTCYDSSGVLGTASVTKESDTRTTGTVTVAQTNSWLVGLGQVQFGVPPTAGPGTSVVGSATDGYIGFIDSNGTVGSGSQSLNVDGPGTAWAIVAELEDASPASGATPRHHGMLLGVGK